MRVFVSPCLKNAGKGHKYMAKYKAAGKTQFRTDILDVSLTFQ